MPTVTASSNITITIGAEPAREALTNPGNAIAVPMIRALHILLRSSSGLRHSNARNPGNHARCHKRQITKLFNEGHFNPNTTRRTGFIPGIKLHSDLTKSTNSFQSHFHTLGISIVSNRGRGQLSKRHSKRPGSASASHGLSLDTPPSVEGSSPVGQVRYKQSNEVWSFTPLYFMMVSSHLQP